MGLIQVSNTVFDLDELEIFKPDHQKQPLIEFKDDPVALACASYRHWIEAPHTRWADFDMITVLPEDRVKAEELKKYYRERFVMEALKNTRNQSTSEFRQKLYKVITDSAELRQGDIGLLYRLPYFYQEDQDLDSVMEVTDSAEARRIGENISGKFTLIKRILRSRKHGDYYDYWMHREGESAPFLFIVKQDNVLNSLWNGLIKQTVSLNGRTWIKHHQGFHRQRCYYQLVIDEVV